jgi:glycosyltransferase involved in cell wall biosynthesis
LAQFLQSQGIEVVLVSPKDAYVEKLQAEGFRWIPLWLSRRSVNPSIEVLTVAHLLSIYLREKPVAVHHFTLKCVLYGTLAAKLSGTKAVLNAITGLGYLFSSHEWKARILRPLVILLFRQVLTGRGIQVVFQNKDDLQVFAKLKLIVPHQAILIRSSGIDPKRFSPDAKPLETPSTPVVLFASRLIAEKGVVEFIEAARLLERQGIGATFQVIGAPDPGNPSSISPMTLANWHQDGVVDLLGHVDGVEHFIARATIVVLPSHGGEGVPRILLEAAAMEKPVVATDVPGCREIVEHGKNGLLVPVGDVAQLAKAIELLLKDPELCKGMGRVGREKVLCEFDARDVVKKTAKAYAGIGVPL